MKNNRYKVIFSLFGVSLIFGAVIGKNTNKIYLDNKQAKEDLPYISSTDNAAFSLHNSRGQLQTDNAGGPKTVLRYKIIIHDNSTNDFYNEATYDLGKGYPFELAYSTEAPTDYNDYEGTFTTYFFFSADESIVEDNEYVFYTTNLEDYNEGQYVWLLEMNNLNVSIDNQNTTYNKIKVLDTGETSEDPYINTTFALDQNLAYTGLNPEDGPTFSSSDEDNFAIDSIDKESRNLKFSLKIGNPELKNNYIYDPKISLNNLDTNEVESYKVHEYKDPVAIEGDSKNSTYYYFETTLDNNANYQILSLIDFGIKQNNTTGHFLNPVDLGEDMIVSEENTTFDLTLSSFIENESFKVEKVTETTISFSLTIHNMNATNNEWKSKLQIILLNTDTTEEIEETAYISSIDNDKYTYRISNLEVGITYKFISIIDSGLALGNEYNNQDNEILFADELNVDDDELSVFTEAPGMSLAAIIVIALLILIIIMFIIVIIVFAFKRKELKEMNEILINEY